MWSLASAKGQHDAMLLATSCCGREAILGAGQPVGNAVAAILSGQWGGNQAVIGKCCRRIWEKAPGLVPGDNLRGRQAARWQGMVNMTVSCSSSERGVGGLGLEGASSCPLSSPAQW